MDSPSIKLECLKLAVQVATAESLDKSMRAPEVERVAKLVEKFYDLVIAGPSPAEDVESPTPEAVPTGSQQVQGSKKPKADKDRIFD